MIIHTPLRLLLALTFVTPSLLACSPSEEEEGEAEGGDESALDEPALGDTPLPGCEATMLAYEQLAGELALPDPDLDYVIELYRGEGYEVSSSTSTPGATALQGWVREVGGRLGRVEAGVLIDDAAIEAAIELAASEQGEARRLALLDVLGVLRRVALFDARDRLTLVSSVLPDPARDPGILHAEWDEAYCVWSGVLAPLARTTDARTDEGWEARIEAGFELGSAGIIGPDEAWAPDEFATKPAKQIVEKGTYAVALREIVALAQEARDAGDAAAAREALGLFALIEDRVAGRNTPAIAEIEAMLAGAPDAVDPDLIRDELAIAFVKRTRKYCDEALLSDTLGTVDAYTGAQEGTVYALSVLPYMSETLGDAGFVADDYMAAWAAYTDAVLAEDVDAATAASELLVMWNCAMQAELGIAECTSDVDEM